VHTHKQKEKAKTHPSRVFMEILCCIYKYTRALRMFDYYQKMICIEIFVFSLIFLFFYVKICILCSPSSDHLCICEFS
jgi:uncharacterized membrane protein YagU involved in acid resistance